MVTELRGAAAMVCVLFAFGVSGCKSDNPYQEDATGPAAQEGVGGSGGDVSGAAGGSGGAVDDPTPDGFGGFVVGGGAGDSGGNVGSVGGDVGGSGGEAVMPPDNHCASHQDCAADEYCDPTEATWHGCVALSAGWERDPSGVGAQRSSRSPPCTPQGEEVENGLDDDCNGLIDEGSLCDLPDLSGPCGGWQGVLDGHGACVEDAAQPLPIQPEGDLPDGIDNDCNGMVDDDMMIVDAVPGGERRCLNGVCQVACEAGRRDQNGAQDDGCENTFACGDVLPDFTDGFQRTVDDVDGDFDCDGVMPEHEPLLVAMTGIDLVDNPSYNHLRDGVKTPNTSDAGRPITCFSDDYEITSEEGCDGHMATRLNGAVSVCLAGGGFHCGSINEAVPADRRPRYRDYREALEVVDGRSWLFTLRHDLAPGTSGTLMRIGSTALSIDGNAMLVLTWNGEDTVVAPFPADRLCSVGITYAGGVATATMQDVRDGQILEVRFEVAPPAQAVGPDDVLLAFPGDLDSFVAWDEARDLFAEMVRLSGLSERMLGR